MQDRDKGPTISQLLQLPFHLYFPSIYALSEFEALPSQVCKDLHLEYCYSCRLQSSVPAGIHAAKHDA